MIFQNFGFNQNYPIAASVGFDVDAQKFINASGISGSNADAINTLVVSLKDYNLWNKFYVIYPFIGGTESSCKWNLVNTGSYTATFFNGVVFSNTGIQTDGVNDYMNTNYNISDLTRGNSHVYLYKRTGRNTGDNIDFGAFDETAAFRGILAATQLTTTLSRGRMYGTQMDNSAAPYTGSFMVTADSTHSSVYKGTTEVATIALSNPGAIASGSMVLGAMTRLQDPVTGPNYHIYFTSASYAFNSIGTHISGSDLTNYYNTVQAYQTTLGRQV